MRQVRRVRDRRDPRRRIWVTETGASTTARNGEGRRLSEIEQASAIANALDQLEAAPDVRAALVYTLVDRPWRSEAPAESGFGVLRRGPTLEPKRAFCRIAPSRAPAGPLLIAAPAERAVSRASSRPAWSGTPR